MLWTRLNPNGNPSSDHNRTSDLLAASAPISDRLQRLRRIYRNYTVRVLLQALVTVWAVITFTFFLIRLMPGNPVDVYIDFLMNQQNLTYQERTCRRPDSSTSTRMPALVTQYVEYMGQLLHGDLGQSIVSTGTQVIDQIARFLPWTLFAVGLGLLISFVLGISLGTLMAYNRNSLLDHITVAAVIDPERRSQLHLGAADFDHLRRRVEVVHRRRTARHFDTNVTPGFNIEFIAERPQTCLPAGAGLHHGHYWLVDAQHAQQHRQHAQRRLRQCRAKRAA